jgi:hypothetical protein
MMCYLEPCMLSSLSVLKAPPCCVRALSSAHPCPRHAIALPVVFSAPMMSHALVMPARRRCSVCWRKGRTPRGQLSSGLLPNLMRSGGRVALRWSLMACLRCHCDAVSRYPPGSESLEAPIRVKMRLSLPLAQRQDRCALLLTSLQRQRLSRPPYLVGCSQQASPRMIHQRPILC